MFHFSFILITFNFFFYLLVQRTRSGRARKTPVVAKKSPVKKLLARATRSPKKIREIEGIEVCNKVYFAMVNTLFILLCDIRFS